MHHGLADGRVVIHERKTEVACARVSFARRKVSVGKLDQRIMLPEGHCFGRGGDAGNGAGEQSAAESATHTGPSERCWHLDGRRPLERTTEPATRACRLTGERQSH